jgi:hypothetical protein
MLNRTQGAQSVDLLNSQDGTAMVTVLLLLVLLTFVALTATDTTINEKSMVRNEAVFEQNFSLAESAALEGLQKLASTKNDAIEELIPSRLSSASANKDLLINSDSDEMADILKKLDGNGDRVIDKNDASRFEKSLIGAETYRLAVMLPIASGDSLSLTTAKSRLYRYDVFGLSNDFGGTALVLVGCKRRLEH